MVVKVSGERDNMNLKTGDFVLLKNTEYKPSAVNPVMGTFFETYGIVRDIDNEIVIVEWQAKELTGAAYYEDELLNMVGKEISIYYTIEAFKVKTRLKSLFPDAVEKITLANFCELSDALEGRAKLYALKKLIPYLTFGCESPYEKIKLVIQPNWAGQKIGCKSIW